MAEDQNDNPKGIKWSSLGFVVLLGVAIVAMLGMSNQQKTQEKQQTNKRPPQSKRKRVHSSQGRNSTLKKSNIGEKSMGVTDKFKSFVQNLRTDNDAVIASRYKAITKRLNQDFWNSNSETAHSRYLGSYGRGTAIKGFSDIDLMIELPVEVYKRYDSYIGNGQSALLQAVKSSVLNTYSTTDIGGDGQVVVVKFSDNTRFEIVPTFPLSNSGYLFPDTNGGGRWRDMYPLEEMNAINESNRKYDKKVKHLVRMMKAWKNKHNVPITGMLIETLAMQFMDMWAYNHKSFVFYDWMVRDFFKFLSERDRNQTYWKARGSGQHVKRTGTFEQKAKAAYDLAVKAVEYEAHNYVYSANVTWKEIFGSLFVG